MVQALLATRGPRLRAGEDAPVPEPVVAEVVGAAEPADPGLPARAGELGVPARAASPAPVAPGLAPRRGECGTPEPAVSGNGAAGSDEAPPVIDPVALASAIAGVAPALAARAPKVARDCLPRPGRGARGVVEEARTRATRPALRLHLRPARHGEHRAKRSLPCGKREQVRALLSREGRGSTSTHPAGPAGSGAAQPAGRADGSGIARPRRHDPCPRDQLVLGGPLQFT
jgi:hypothetical protein